MDNARKKPGPLWHNCICRQRHTDRHQDTLPQETLNYFDLNSQRDSPWHSSLLSNLHHDPNLQHRKDSTSYSKPWTLDSFSYPSCCIILMNYHPITYTLTTDQPHSFLPLPCMDISCAPPTQPITFTSCTFIPIYASHPVCIPQIDWLNYWIILLVNSTSDSTSLSSCSSTSVSSPVQRNT